MSTDINHSTERETGVVWVNMATIDEDIREAIDTGPESAVVAMLIQIHRDLDRIRRSLGRREGLGPYKQIAHIPPGESTEG